MPQAITAVYENGVFIPQTPVNLPQHTAVIISLPAVSHSKSGKRFSALLQEPLIAEHIVIPPRDELHER
ncbi:antitoxin family protein [Trichlorobacter lovleyi]|uniref:DUF104 domain-containing protein n=1 Tax=Trichlorobacter lovleyi (strain ATCC BAA-1151 / DSM 17278 / SZ) TaxID=398767 RepID=B3E3G7_TRIL1|nr:antitoxin family protein [Trichlorobacter lovleyi]ACD95786.1 Protein of unknown function DUF104 [Trichlorobacter lovleyi SZ]